MNDLLESPSPELPPSNAATPPFERILGLRFFNGNAAGAVEYFLRNKGLLAVPAVPALSKLQYDQDYRRALIGADVLLLDSGLVGAASKVVSGRAIANISGVEYLESLLRSLRDETDVVWLVRSDAAAGKARDQLCERGYNVREHFFRPVPDGTAEDHRLLLQLEEKRPRHIIIATSGGSQEKLGYYLREFLLYRPCLHCVGAALGFLTRAERPIPKWAMAAHLGWLFRFVSQPLMILPRIGIALGVLRMLLRHRAELPPLQPRWADV